MLRWRFLPGLVAGLLIGLPLGAVVAVVVLPSASDSAGTSPQIAELSRRLVEAQHDKEALNRQLDEFRALAERMTTSFGDLERRFKAMEGELRARELVVEPTATPVGPPSSEAAPAESAP